MGIVVYLLAIAVWITSEFWIALREWGTLRNDQDKYTKTVFAACVAAALGIAIMGPRPPSATIFWSRGIMEFLGSVTILSGVFVRVFSVLTLGPFFRTTVMIQKGQKLVTTGLYQYVRHPSYLGTLITIAGLGLAADNGFTLAAMLVVMGYGVRQRIVVEEEVMEREFKNEYASYKRRSWRLIPKVY